MFIKKYLFLILVSLVTNGLCSQSTEFSILEDGVVVPSVIDHNNISSPVDGQLVFDNNSNSFWFYSSNTSQWFELGGDNLGDHKATQNIDINFWRINNLPTPTSPNHAANKSYVDAHQDSDADDQNEIQQMSVSETGDTFYLEGGGHIIVPGISDANYIKDGDGNVYNEVEILGQVWLEPSLRTTTYNDGSSIDNPADVATFISNGNSDIPSYMWYDQDSVTYALEYGALYNWFVVDTVSNGNKNVCPVGYRPPNIDELVQLRDTLSPTNTSLVGQHLKTVGYDYWLPNGGTGLDTYGFSAKGAGRIGVSESQWLHRQMFFLTSSDYVISTSANSGALNDFQNSLSLYGSSKLFGYSIRCIKEE